MFELNTYPKDKNILCRETVSIELDMINELKPFILKMKEYVKNNENCVGLSANQVWKYEQYPAPKIFVMLVTDNRLIQEFINPTVHFSGKTLRHVEGCLSRPNKKFLAKRSKNCTIHYYDIEGKEHIEKYGGFYAQIIGHEMQHLSGNILKREVNVR